MADEKKPLVDAWLARLRNYPAVAVLVIAAIAVGGVAQFTTALGKIAEILPWFEPARADLRICEIDLENRQIDICNDGDAAAPTEMLHLAFSESWYIKPGWNNVVLIGYRKYIEDREIPPRTKLAVQVPELERADPGTEFMIDAHDRVRERDETNNCVKTDGRPVTCRPVAPILFGE